MPAPRVTVVVPTLGAGQLLTECLDSLERQTCRDFEVVVVDNSGSGAAPPRQGVRLLRPASNLGFGAALNRAWRESAAEFLATLNDDAMAEPDWLAALLEAAASNPAVGMFASCIRLFPGELLDSAGMLLAPDGSSRQRGHRKPAGCFSVAAEVLFPSGCAALYRRAMLEQAGLFDEDFFLYCEDTDLGLRARWAGWSCLYVPSARVLHHYSKSAGRASSLKAYYVERNRLFVAIKNFPLRMWPAVPPAALARYFWHVLSAARGRGAAAEFHRLGGHPLRLAWLVVRAHAAVLARLPGLLRQRRIIRAGARIDAAAFHRLARQHRISSREVAAL